MSTHYREDPSLEIVAALEGNTPNSVWETLTTRLLIERRQSRQDDEAIQRINLQLAYLREQATQQAVA